MYEGQILWRVIGERLTCIYNLKQTKLLFVFTDITV